LNSGYGAGSNPKIVLPYVTDVWVSGLIAFYSSVTLIFIFNNKNKNNNSADLFTFFFKSNISVISLGFWKWQYYFLSVVAFLLQLGWFVGYRTDGGMWGLCLLALFLLVIYVERRLLAMREGLGFADPPQQTHPAMQMNGNAYDKSLNSDFESNAAMDKKAENESEPKRRSCITLGCCGKWALLSLRVVAFLLTCLLLGGCWQQASGYRYFPPNGTYIELKDAGGVKGYNQRILTQCVGPRDPSVPTFWVEVGGGGHSMSDLWGLRDYITTNFNRRYCSYDPPGTGWSDPAVSTQVRARLGCYFILTCVTCLFF
jgi:hypothetical protein